MAEFEIVFWYWWIATVLLLIVEILAPGFFFLWIAVSAFVTGGLVLLLPAMAADMQLFVFSSLSVASVAVWRIYFKRHPPASDHPLLNERGEQYVGRIFTLEQPIVNGGGKIRVDDTLWKIRGDDAESGSRVRVVAVKGTILVVEKTAAR
ncbi:MAG: NfeD family protein [Gammaproteobacteria bacterium]